MTCPVPFTARRELVSPVKARLVVVAEVEVEFVMDKLELVEEALEMNPLLKYQERLSLPAPVVDAV